ncbi:MAG TPA: GntR family transcriptional regulator [Elusimicrobiota bacterium]|jgi:GntR family transcriptional regulator|nr:GntR family transcriptional regulator [Elusimicrobiota bacterium]
MLDLDLSSSTPVYDQIKSGLKGLVAKGRLRPGDEAPSIRGLAASLKVNPNTVARAYRELAEEGFLESRRGGTSVVARSALQLSRDCAAPARQAFLESARRARQAGLSWKELSELIVGLMATEP